MFTVRIKGKRNPNDPDSVKINLIFYKSGYNRIHKLLQVTGPYEYWDKATKKFMPTYPEHKAKNKLLQNARYKYLNVAEKWEHEGRNWQPIELSHYFDERNKSRDRYITISEMFDRIIERHIQDERFKNGRIFTGFSTAENYRYVKKSLENFTRKKYKRDLSRYQFRDIDAKFLKEYVFHEQQRGYKNGNRGGVEKKLKGLRAVFAMAKDEKVYGVNLSLFIPYKRKMKTIYWTTKAISLETMQRIENVDRSILVKREELYLDLFLFSYYAAGMNGIDICFMEWNWIKDGKIIYERLKQDTIATVVITNDVERMLDKYRKEGYMNFVFPIFKKRSLTEKQMYSRVERITLKVGQTMAKICAHLGIKEKVTWGTARSNFICKMIDAGYHPMQVAKMCGNSPQTIYKYYYVLGESQT